MTRLLRPWLNNTLGDAYAMLEDYESAADAYNLVLVDPIPAPTVDRSLVQMKLNDLPAALRPRSLQPRKSSAMRSRLKVEKRSDTCVSQHWIGRGSADIFRLQLVPWRQGPEVA